MMQAKANIAATICFAVLLEINLLINFADTRFPYFYSFGNV